MSDDRRTPARGVRLPTAGGDESRDRYVPKHPTPPGVRARSGDIRPPVDFEREEHTDVGGPPKTPPPGVAVPRTISDSDMLSMTLRRSGETKNIAIDTQKATTTTLDRVESLRKETNQRIEKLDAKVDGVIRVVGNVREEVGRQGGQNTLIISMLEDLQDDRQRTEHVKTTTRIAEVEVDKSRALTDLEIRRTQELALIEESKADEALRRKNLEADKALRRKIVEQVALKVLAAVGVIWAVISAYYMAR